MAWSSILKYLKILAKHSSLVDGRSWIQITMVALKIDLLVGIYMNGCTPSDRVAVVSTLESRPTDLYHYNFSEH